MTKKIFAVQFIVFALGLCAALPLRVVELLTAIDPGTGFYKTDSGVVTALNVLLIVIVVLLLIPLLLRKSGAGAGVLRTSPAGAVLSFGIAILSVLAGVELCFLTPGSNPAGNLFCILTVWLSALYFALHGLKRLGSPRSLAVWSLLPVLWGVVILVVSFMKYTTIASISGYLFDVLKLVFVLLFLYYHALAAGRMPGKRITGSMAAFGLPAALFCALTTLPNYIAYAINRPCGSLPTFSGVLYLLLGVYAVYASAQCCFGKQEPEPQPQEEETKPAADEE